MNDWAIGITATMAMFAVALLTSAILMALGF